MKTLKSSILESYSNCLIEEVLEKLKPNLESICDSVSKNHFEERGEELSLFSREMLKLELTWDLCKSIEQYLDSGDRLVDFSSTFTSRGNTFEVFMTISRNGEKYALSTEMITAGGYNIQRLHYRYLTKTNAPKIRNFDDSKSKSIENKIKGLKKHQKLELEIQKYRDRIAEAQEKIDQNLKFTDEEIFQKVRESGKYLWAEWSEIVSRGADKNYGYSEENYNIQKEESRVGDIIFWKSMNIRSHQNMIRELTKSIEKLEKRLQLIVNSL